MTTKERFIEYLKTKGIGQTAFEESSGLSRGSISQKSGFSANSIEKIAPVCPDLNLDWLITGKGAMLKSEHISTIKERINHFIENKNIDQTEFLKNIGLSFPRFDSTKGSLPERYLKNIKEKYPQLNIEWLVTGEGSMLNDSSTKNDIQEGNQEYSSYDSEYAKLAMDSQSGYKASKRNLPRIPSNSLPGTLTKVMDQKEFDSFECVPRIELFPEYDFTVSINDNSMEPKYEKGDEVACKRIENAKFIQWGKVYVLDTTQGIIVKRIYEDDGNIRCSSYNSEYPDFSISNEDIYSMNFIVGLIRL